MTEVNVTIDDVIKVNTEAGDTLLVTMPEHTASLPLKDLDEMMKAVGKTFDSLFARKEIQVIVVPYGMEVQLIKSSALEDK